MLLFVITMTSCSNEEIRIKRALKLSIPEYLKAEYKYDSHILLETLLKSNLTDSIASIEQDIQYHKQIMKLDSIRLVDIKHNMHESREQKASTLYYLRSAYDDIIESFEEMEDEVETKIGEHKQSIFEDEKRIEFFTQSMAESESPIVFYKIKHNYKIRGMHKDTTLFLNYKYEIVNL